MSDTLILGTPNIAKDLQLKPQARQVLSHLLKGYSITPMEAMTVYTIPRLAASIHEIRKAGYEVVSTIREDARGHKYGRYELKSKVH